MFMEAFSSRFKSLRLDRVLGLVGVMLVFSKSIFMEVGVVSVSYL